MTDIINTAPMIGKTVTRACEPFWVRVRGYDGGPNHELILERTKIPRKPVEYERYRILETDPNAFMLLHDPDFQRIRVRKITTFQKDGETFETIENDYPLERSKWDRIENMRSVW